MASFSFPLTLYPLKLPLYPTVHTKNGPQCSYRAHDDGALHVEEYDTRPRSLVAPGKQVCMHDAPIMFDRPRMLRH